MLIDFSKIPGSTKLFLEYIDNFENVKKYYSNNFRDEKSYEKTFSKIENMNGKALTKIIKNQYQGFTYSNKTKSNIEFLNENNTIAVFTGQQLGLLGGPLYTFYKIFTTIKLSEYLNDKFRKYKFVPIFWMAGDDHDFDEINNLNVINTENEIEKIIYNDGLEDIENRGCVGSLKFEKTILDFNKKLESSVRQTEFSKELFELNDQLFSSKITIADSFFKLLFRIFDEAGLIIFNPQDKEVKKLLIPIFKNELENFKTHTNDILLNSIDLDENYHSQVKIKPINLFLSDETGRHLIEPVENEFRLKGKRKRITKEKMLSLLEEKPENFSANVLLRPICEDYLFPTGFYVAGPSEVCYYAQTLPLYKHFNLQQPYVFPRASATILEGNIAKILMKYNLSTPQFFRDFQELKNEILKNTADNSVEQIFNSTNEELINSLLQLANSLEKIDKNLVNLTKTTSEKIIHQLEVLKSKAMKSQENKYDATLRQVTKAKNYIYPNDNLQERELGIFNFVNKYGFDFFDWLYNELDIHEFKHQVLEL